MPAPGQIPYYMTGPASRGSALPKWAAEQTRLEKMRQKGRAPKPKPNQPKAKPKPKVIGGPTSTVTRPNSPVVTDFKPTVPPPQGTRKPPVTKPKPGGKPGGGKHGGGKKGGGTVVGGKPGKQGAGTPGIGFDPKVMAQTLTDLGYDAQIAAINQQIRTNQGNMQEALADIQGWANQIEGQRATGAGEAEAAWAAAQQQSQANDANIAQLFGGAAGGEAAAYSGVGEDLLSMLAASDKSFDARMAPILRAQGADYSRRATGAFNQVGKELADELLGAKKEKGQAYKQNLLELMDMAWGRQQDMLQYETAQQALEQARALQGYELQKAQQDIVSGNQQIQANKLELRAQKIALKKATAELQKITQGTGGIAFDWSDPTTRPRVASAAYNGALAPNGTFMINPRLAWENAQRALALVGLSGDPQAMDAIWQAFQYNLNLSHAHKKWGQYYINKNGQLVYDPTRKFKRKK